MILGLSGGSERRRGVRATVPAALIGVLILAACASQPTPVAPVAKTATSTATGNSPQPRTQASATAVSAPAAGATASQATPVALAPPPAPAPRVAPPPPKLIGMSRSDLFVLLGVPSLIRNDAPAQIWQYANSACVLHLFLYERGAGSYRVEHYEVSERGAAPAGGQACVGGFLGAARRAVGIS